MLQRRDIVRTGYYQVTVLRLHHRKWLHKTHLLWSEVTIPSVELPLCDKSSITGCQTHSEVPNELVHNGLNAHLRGLKSKTSCPLRGSDASGDFDRVKQ